MVIGFIGLGNMASAMVRGIAAAKLEGVTLCGHNPHPEKAKALAESCGLRLCASNAEVLAASDVVVLAVKPQILEGVLAEIAPLAAGRQSGTPRAARRHGGPAGPCSRRRRR